MLNPGYRTYQEELALALEGFCVAYEQGTLDCVSTRTLLLAQPHLDGVRYWGCHNEIMKRYRNGDTTLSA